ncbi:MAG: 1-phosphofructokinase family hexose kinase [Azospirillaceae bacterium]|nr:1-phosphofructokinase family hexose kinase [Azospirillaceae bacterium]
MDDVIPSEAKGDHQPFIITLTPNPVLDLESEVGSIEPSHKLRTTGDSYAPGGGGINVSQVVCQRGGTSLAIYLAGGDTGHLIQGMLDTRGVKSRIVPIHGNSRVSYTVHDRSTDKEYRFVPQGPHVDEGEWRKAIEILDDVGGDWVVGSGSLAPGMPEDFYLQAAARVQRDGRKFALDTSGPALKAAMGHGIDLVKCSLSEFESILGRKVSDYAAQDHEALALVHSGAVGLLAVTLGEEGALLATPEGVLRRKAPPVQARSAVGAGDSFLAGMVVALARGDSYAQALDAGIAAGTDWVVGAMVR